MKRIISLVLLAFALFMPQVSLAALDADTCASLVVTQLKSANPQITGDVETNLTAYWKLICTALITHIQNSAVVSTVVSNAVPALPGPVTGSGTVN